MLSNWVHHSATSCLSGKITSTVSGNTPAAKSSCRASARCVLISNLELLPASCAGLLLSRAPPTALVHWRPAALERVWCPASCRYNPHARVSLLDSPLLLMDLSLRAAEPWAPETLSPASQSPGSHGGCCASSEAGIPQAFCTSRPSTFSARA